MANEIQIFENSFEGSDVEIIIDNNNEPLFELYSTGMALGYYSTAKSKRYPYKDRINKIISNAEITPVSHGVKLYLSESQLYDFMLEAKSEKCKTFHKWITNSVLPTIRKTGGYISNGELFVNTYFDSVPDEQKTLIRGLITNIEEKQKENIKLKNTNELLVAETLTWADRPLLNAIVRRYAGYACNGDFSYAWVEFKKEILYKHSININARITAHLNKTGKKTKPKTLDMLTDDELVDALKTVVSMCENKGVDISDLLDKKKNEK